MAGRIAVACAKTARESQDIGRNVEYKMEGSNATGPFPN